LLHALGRHDAPIGLPFYLWLGITSLVGVRAGVAGTSRRSKTVARTITQSKKTPMLMRSQRPMSGSGGSRGSPRAGSRVVGRLISYVNVI
jgi:hypothetical protein